MQTDAYILIGGSSSRMGRDKATLAFGETTLAGRAAAIVHAALPNARVTFVAADAGQFPGRNVIGDIEVERGPLGGLHAALKHAEREWIFVLGCDLPFVTGDLIQYLASRTSDEIDAVVPLQSDGRVQPLCAFYHVTPCLKAADEVLQNTGTPPLRAIFGNVKMHTVLFDEIMDLPGSGDFFVNVNDPSDFQRATSILSAK